MQPISTAPKNRDIVVWTPDIDDGEDAEFITIWDAAKNVWAWERCMWFSPNHNPTHWRECTVADYAMLGKMIPTDGTAAW